MLKPIVNFFLMSFGISADEEAKQRRERERWARQRQIAEREAQRRSPGGVEGPAHDTSSGTISNRSTSTKP